MRSTCKKLITDINRNSNIETNLPKYLDLLMGHYNLYATVKMCMNYYTMREMVEEGANISDDCQEYFKTITAVVDKHILSRETVDACAIDRIRDIRAAIEFKMKNLTAYTDGYEVYEYLLNRTEARVYDKEEDVDIQTLCDKLYSYVFMDEKDTVLVNSKLSLVMSQLPVRMTKIKFFDIVARTVAIYNGSEKKSLDEFVDMLKTAVLISRPEGFETEYKELYSLYEDLSKTDYKTLDKEGFENFEVRLKDAVALIDEEVSVYMLLQEIVNDVYAILLTIDKAYEVNNQISGYKSALTILSACVNDSDIEDIPERLMPKFIDIEGVQEDIYEVIMLLEAAFPDIKAGKGDDIANLNLSEAFDNCELIEKLLSTSLFIDISKAEEAELVMADSDYVNEAKEQLIEELNTLFKASDKMVTRSMMCKLLAAMPIFMNTKQEIKDYFEYVLYNCKDRSELTACNKLLCDIMEEE